MVAFETFSNVIDGKLQSTATTRHGVNPATLEDLPPVPVSSQEDLDVAVVAAAKATTEWQKVPIEKRRDAVSRLADALEAQADDFAAYLTKEQGKPVRKSGS
jgi:acyl-CoA reductase-like NAD-dependent aldehyde dehydrogenase